ncbi:MAG: hypothetical protein COV00_02170 [Candidatus Tagabacteria bacterium CG10_big_fil_rev_8_21_14_0_10_40_13]|uniref:HTH HARE-type domain-containing protein n=1 Tax=Candidatus Tagabacteria bacterium CG10_big_fil_rev_8_21_14_0_10_40_13 TaxID=1975022 RepID=A0A2M8L8Q6_9BACT|nr:MAG: hypothetical protein COV00_02170 [Candidatus Tagabacteria bacterium CG10_big_fil_rev_8_21_14_0_10_40_13]
MSITENKGQPTWAEAIETVMKSHGYFATLKQLHEEAPKLKEHSGKTPNMTINYVVQVDERFTKIMPGLWALSEYLDKLPNHLNPKIRLVGGLHYEFTKLQSSTTFNYPDTRTSVT